MVLEAPMWIAGPTGTEVQHTTQMDRRLLDALYADGGGVIEGFVVSERGAGANMSVDISSGYAIIPGVSVANQRKYLVSSTAIENVVVPAAPGSGSRTDLVIARVYDSESSGVDDKFALEVLEGPATVPDDAILIAEIAVTNTTSSITNALIDNDVRSQAVLKSVAPVDSTTLVPAGAVEMFAMNTAPNGWLKANGAVVSRTTYAALFSAIGTTFGAGDGTTTFALPDLRGEFLRAWDDGAGIDDARAFGSTQGDAIRNIVGHISGQKGLFTGASGVFTRSSVNGRADGTGDNNDRRADFDASTVVPTAEENRPRNIALLACIKY
jgi:hypothetical protein